jgi:hypothetical protein
VSVLQRTGCWTLCCLWQCTHHSTTPWHSWTITCMLHRDARLLLGAFATWWKATNSFVMSVRPHGTTPLRLAGFSWHLIFEDFSRICWENSNLTRTRVQLVHMTVFCWIFLRIINISDKGFRDNQNTHFMFNTLSCPKWVNVGKTQNALLHFDCSNG